MKKQSSHLRDWESKLMRYLDILFTRAYQTQISWSGTSRTVGIEVKVSLRNFERLMKFLYGLFDEYELSFDAIRKRISNILHDSKRRNKEIQRESTVHRKGSHKKISTTSNNGKFKDRMFTLLILIPSITMCLLCSAVEVETNSGGDLVRPVAGKRCRIGMLLIWPHYM